MATNTYVALDKVTVGTAVNSVTFSNISQNYTDLVIVANFTGSGSGNNLMMQVGNTTIDTGSNYSGTGMYGNGTSAASWRQTSVSAIQATYAVGLEANNTSSIHLMNYSNTTTYKTVINRSGGLSGTYNATEATVSLWRSTSAINTIKLYGLNSATISVGSTFSLYGIAATNTADPTGKKYVVETEVEYGGMKAHIDLWLPETGDVVDWKTVKVKNLNYFPTKQQRWQVQVYGYLLDKSGVGKPRNVNLVAIARDGDERDVKVHSEPYDPKIAEEALDWLAAIKESQDAPEPEREENYCKFYCKYFDATGEIGCSGIKKDWVKERGVVIEDAVLDKQALLYMQIDQQIKALNAEKESIKTSLEGFTGTTFSGVEVVWSSLAGRKQVDAKEVEKLLGFVPYIQGQESVRLTVKQTGGK